MELEIENAKEFKRGIDSVSVLIDEAEFVLNEFGLELKATDPSQISLVDFKLEKSSFKKFSIEQETTIGLDLDYLSQILSRAKSDDTLRLSLNPEKTSLKLSLIGTSERNFSMPLIDVSKSKIPNPKMEFDAQITMKASVLQDSLKDASLISSHVTMGANEKEFFIKANSSKGDLNSLTEKNSDDVKKFEVKTNCKSMFPLDYLLDMLKNASSTDSLLVELGSDKPVRISYSIGQANVMYFLAPRIENN